MNEQLPSSTRGSGFGSLDGEGAADHDQPFAGFRTYVFSTCQLARLMQVRGELLEACLGYGRWAVAIAQGR